MYKYNKDQNFTNTIDTPKIISNEITFPLHSKKIEYKNNLRQINTSKTNLIKIPIYLYENKAQYINDVLIKSNKL